MIAADGYRQQSTKSRDSNGGCNGVLKQYQIVQVANFTLAMSLEIKILQKPGH
jgi:hypothetical protein